MIRYLLLFLSLTTAPLLAQEPMSIHRIERDRYDSIEAARSNDPARPTPLPLRKSSAEEPMVFGYHPYWTVADAHLSYDYTPLSTIGYFSYEVDTATGRYKTVRGWPTTPIISYAHTRGVKVVLVVTNFGFDANDKILADPTKANTLIESIVEEVRAAGGDGVNIDFESVRGARRADLVAFMTRLADRIHETIPGGEVSMATPAVDWSNAFDLAALASLCDYLIMMGYDYHWSGAQYAGPVAPLDGGTYNVKRSIDTYLAAGVPPSKLLLGVPWYGYNWPVLDSNARSATLGGGTAILINNAMSAVTNYGRRFDPVAASPWYRYFGRDSLWHQVWYEDSTSLGMKYAFVRERGLRGVGIWALGYEGGNPVIWNGLRQAFVLSSVAASDSPLHGASLRPNPASSTLTIGWTTSKPAATTVSIVDPLGRVVSHQRVERADARRQELSLSIDELPSGMYRAVIDHDGTRESVGFVVAR